ncbi:WAS/WASL-interacting protein family member 3-like [Panicum virgatum]|uniref:WAS/WASL-interacting protein family member 3-like n=1 Tax=Panicum virgatum TaxID=38727 RepID=UPI0019D53F9A|nr:WAS/WASL-interacting protein family member 3-like [Panicum virgatum]
MVYSTTKMARSAAPRSTAASASAKARHGSAEPWNTTQSLVAAAAAPPPAARVRTDPGLCHGRIQAARLRHGRRLRDKVRFVGVDSPAGGGGSKAGRGKNTRGCCRSSGAAGVPELGVHSGRPRGQEIRRVRMHHENAFCTEYEKSKFLADRIALQAAAEEAPITLVYPGVIKRKNLPGPAPQPAVPPHRRSRRAAPPNPTQPRRAAIDPTPPRRRPRPRSPPALGESPRAALCLARLPGRSLELCRPAAGPAPASRLRLRRRPWGSPCTAPCLARSARGGCWSSVALPPTPPPLPASACVAGPGGARAQRRASPAPPGEVAGASSRCRRPRPRSSPPPASPALGEPAAASCLARAAAARDLTERENGGKEKEKMEQRVSLQGI